jgi:hypothetical protein
MVASVEGGKNTMLAEIYLLQLENAAQAAEKRALKQDYDFVPFSLDAFASEKARPMKKHNERSAA